MKYYLAYGSNLNTEQMANRCPDAHPVGTAEIMDYELVFRRGYLTIEPKAGQSVPVGIWEISDSDERKLDRYEGFPKFYFKEWFQIRVPNVGKRLCMAYIMTDGHPIQAPSGTYFRTVDKGYGDFGFTIREWEKLFVAYMRAKQEDPDQE